MKENENTELIVPPDELPIDPGDAEESLYHMKRKVFHTELSWEKIRDFLRDTTVSLEKIVFQKMLLAFRASILL